MRLAEIYDLVYRTAISSQAEIDFLEQVFQKYAEVDVHDILDLAATCKFRNCAHETEPGCAVQAAIADGRLDPARLDRWRKLEAETRHNSETVAEARARGKAFGRMVKEVKTFDKRSR